jgi:hypothetical protein
VAGPEKSEFLVGRMPFVGQRRTTGQVRVRVTLDPLDRCDHEFPELVDVADSTRAITS